MALTQIICATWSKSLSVSVPQLLLCKIDFLYLSHLLWLWDLQLRSFLLVGVCTTTFSLGADFKASRASMHYLVMQLVKRQPELLCNKWYQNHMTTSISDARGSCSLIYSGSSERIQKADFNWEGSRRRLWGKGKHFKFQGGMNLVAHSSNDHMIHHVPRS